MDAGASARERAARFAEQEAELERQLRNVRQRRQAWEAGVAGEERVAALLGELPPGWRVLHDRRKAPRSPANIDHIAIGPTGVHVLDAKNWTGTLSISGSGVMCGGWPRNDETRSVLELRNQIAGELSDAGFVAPTYGVIALAGDDNLAEPRVHNTIAFMPPSYLTAGMTGLAAALTAEQVYRIWEYLDDAHPPRSQRTASAAMPRPAPRRASSERAPRASGRRPQPRASFRNQLLRLVASIAGVILLLTAGPAVLKAFSNGVAKSVTDSLPSTSTPSSGGATRHACDLISARRASRILGARVHAVSIAADFCEFRAPGVARPAAIVGVGPTMTFTRWRGYLQALYGVASCGAYGPGSNTANIAACVDTSNGRVPTSRAYAFDRSVSRPASERGVATRR
jgi:hypothetical protein